MKLLQRVALFFGGLYGAVGVALAAFGGRATKQQKSIED